MTLEEFLKFISESINILSSGVIGVVLGYLFKTQIDHRLAIIRNYQVISANEFNKAAVAFRVAFVDQIFSLGKTASIGESPVHHILDDGVMANHEKAKILFEPFLADNAIVSFDNAWKKYQNTEYYHDKAIEQGAIPKCNHTNDIFKRQLSQFYLDHIYELLEFAKPKVND